VSLLKESSERLADGKIIEERLAEGRLVDLSLDSGLQVLIFLFLSILCMLSQKRKMYENVMVFLLIIFMYSSSILCSVGEVDGKSLIRGADPGPGSVPLTYGSGSRSGSNSLLLVT
jgi:hypothetical protein